MGREAENCGHPDRFGIGHDGDTRICEGDGYSLETLRSKSHVPDTPLCEVEEGDQGL